MGSHDIPPPHVPAHVMPVTNVLLTISGLLWTTTYILMMRQSSRDKTYSMPLFSLALNFAWEFVMGFFAPGTLEKCVFFGWMVIDVGLVYTTLKHGPNEWRHAPWVAGNLGKIFAVTTAACAVGLWSFGTMWLSMGRDVTELAFWTAMTAQTSLSTMSVMSLIVRGHSGGSGLTIWSIRTLGTLAADAYYVWRWWFWNELHEYVGSPFGLFLWAGSLGLDLIYGVILVQVQANERTLPDGRKESHLKELKRNE